MNALAEVAAWIEPVVAGWRYLLSSSFRARTHEAWRHESMGYIVWDVFLGVIGVALSLIVVYFAVVLGWRIAA